MTALELLEKLKLSLQSIDFSAEEVENLLELLSVQENVQLKILDFAYYNEDMQKYVSSQKIECVKASDFETAARWRNKEKKILSLIEFRDEFAIHKSGFYLDQAYLIYYHLGTERNDSQMRDIMRKKLLIC